MSIYTTPCCSDAKGYRLPLSRVEAGGLSRGVVVSPDASVRMSRSQGDGESGCLQREGPPGRTR